MSLAVSSAGIWRLNCSGMPRHEGDLGIGAERRRGVDGQATGGGARVARLVYAAADPKTGAAGSIMNLAQDPRLNHRIDVEGGLMREEAAGLLQEFFRARRGD